jgi:uncharacterized protein
MIVRSWLSPKVRKERGSGVAGDGLFAISSISAGEVVAAKAGHIIDRGTLVANARLIRGAEVQIGDDLFIAPLTPDEFDASMMSINHCCEPNLGTAGNMLYVTMRDVDAGEELTLDYAMYATSTTQEFDCACGTASCRKRITNQDWRRPDLQERYRGYFSWYLERKIAQLRERSGSDDRALSPDDHLDRPAPSLGRG